MPRTLEDTINFLKTVAEGEDDLREGDCDDENIIKIKSNLAKYEQIKFAIDVWLINNIPDRKVLKTIADIIDNKK